MNIWTSERWKLLPEAKFWRPGLHLRFDRDMDPVLCAACKQFAAWLRREYFFPLRIPVYLKNKQKLRCMDGDLAYGTFFEPDSYSVEPYIRIALGDYAQQCQKHGTETATYDLLFTMTHELTHYFQWINQTHLTDIGRERQATVYARDLIQAYMQIENTNTKTNGDTI
ncbi:MAG: hypothetical protein IJL52_04350 [Clostridia bacterium]|nr:hypothetical protein [Clostridia bacterium]